MGVMIDCAGKMILNVRNTIFEMIYINIVDNIDENNINISHDLQMLVDKLYAGQHGIGTDIARFLKSYNDTIFFARLVEESIEKSVKDYPTLTDETKQALWNFHKAILEYAETLK
jgi:hypothetical protein